MAPVMAALLFPATPLSLEGKSVTQERRERPQEKHYLESRAVKIKLREALGLIWLFPNWLQARVVLIKYLMLRAVLRTHPSGGSTNGFVFEALSGEWWWFTFEYYHTGLKSHCLLPLSALVCRQRRESLGLVLGHSWLLVGFAASCFKVHWLLRERQQCERPRPLPALFLAVLASYLVLSRER